MKYMILGGRSTRIEVPVACAYSETKPLSGGLICSKMGHTHVMRLEDTN